MKNVFKYLAIIFLLFSPASSIKAQENIGIEEKLNSTIPLDLAFNDSNGEKVILKDLINKPTIIDFAYYHCPGICTPIMEEVANVVNKSDLEPGEDYTLLSISMDENETPAMAQKKKESIIEIIQRDVPSSSWRFLTGDKSNIKKLADAAGYKFKRTGDQFIHSGALIFVDEKGKICRYLIPEFSERRKGFGILPFDFKMAVLETAKGKATPLIAKVMQFCFSYDPKGKSYVFNFTKISGGVILLLAAIFVIYITVKPKKEKSNSKVL
jgi:protein SCO1/2